MAIVSYEIEENQHFLLIYLQKNKEGNSQTRNKIESLENYVHTDHSYLFLDQRRSEKMNEKLN